MARLYLLSIGIEQAMVFSDIYQCIVFIFYTIDRLVCLVAINVLRLDPTTAAQDCKRLAARVIFPSDRKSVV